MNFKTGEMTLISSTEQIIIKLVSHINVLVLLRNKLKEFEESNK